MKKINWENVTMLVFINNNLNIQFQSKFGNIVQTLTIPNAISTNAYPMHNTLQTI